MRRSFFRVIDFVQIARKFDELQFRHLTRESEEEPELKLFEFGSFQGRIKMQSRESILFH